nr:hypothetical protein [Tanacetum cinerariifolium]
PYGKSKVHIEVLSVLWGNRLPIRTIRDRCLGTKKYRGSNSGDGGNTGYGVKITGGVIGFGGGIGDAVAQRTSMAGKRKVVIVKHAQPEDSNELFQKLLEDLQIINKELTESNHPTFFDDNEDYSVQYKEYLDNSSKNLLLRIPTKEDCCMEVYEKQNKNMEDTMLELIEVYRQKEFHCMHDNVDDLIESALNSKLLSINLESNRRNKKKQVIQKYSTSLKNTSQISPVHAITPVLPNKEPEYSFSMGFEHLSIISETESDEVIESSAKNLLPIPNEYKVTFDDDNECDVPVKDESSSVFTKFSNPLFDDNDNFTSDDDESLSDEDVLIEEFKVYSNPIFDDDEINSDEMDPHCFNAEYNFVESLSNHDTLIDSSLKFDYLEEFSGAFMPTSIADEEHIRREHAEYISLMERLFTINSCPQGKIHVLEELLVDDFISLLENELFHFDHEDDPSFPRPPPEPLDDEFDFETDSGEEIAAVMNKIDELNEDEYFNQG